MIIGKTRQMIERVVLGQGPATEAAMEPPMWPTDAAPNIGNETFKQFYERKWGIRWPVPGDTAPAPMWVAEAQADWLDALAKHITDNTKDKP